MSADEEDVVFEGSQIHQHLLNIGFTDYEFVTQQTETISPLHSYFTNDKSLMLSPIYSLLQELKRSFNAVVAFTHKEYWETSRMFELLGEIFRCPLLNQDDERWLFCSFEQNKAHNDLPSPPKNCNWLELWDSVWGDLLKFPIAASVAVGLASWSVLKMRHQTRLQQLKHLLQGLRIFTRDAKRAFVLIQEHELIQRGFIMAQSGAHVWRLEEASPGVTPSLPALRSVLSSALQAVNMLVLKATHALSSAQVLLPAFRIQINSMGALEKENNSDPTSLAALKCQFHTVLALESQLLLHLALCICPSAWLVTTVNSPQLSSQVFPICSDLTSTLEPLHNELSLCLRVSIAGDVQRTQSVSSHPREPRLLSLYVALHSASLHAQALLAHALAAEEFTVDADDIHKDLEQRLTASLAEMTACSSCLQEAQLRLARLTQTTKSVSLPPPQPPPLPTQLIPVGFTDLEPRGEDQVFEAICDQEFTKLSDSEDEQEFGLKLKVEREVSLHLYLELQSVLAVRAKDWQIREARALGVPVEQLEPTINTPEETQRNEESVTSDTEIAQEYIDLPSPKAMGASPGSWPLTRLPQKPKAPRNSTSCEATVQANNVETLGDHPVSIAVMVAARARQLQQMEDTFGDEGDDESITVE